MGIMKTGDFVSKLSGKPFKNGEKVQRIVNFGTNEQDPKERECAIFEDNSICNLNLLKKKVECPTCYGKGEATFSCCTGEVVNDDILMCPCCYEHLGEEECQDCDGTGFIDEEQETTEHAPSLQLAAELRMEEMKYD
jgi:hypothetical protein